MCPSYLIYKNKIVEVTGYHHLQNSRGLTQPLFSKYHRPLSGSLMWPPIPSKIKNAWQNNYIYFISQFLFVIGPMYY